MQSILVLNYLCHWSILPTKLLLNLLLFQFEHITFFLPHNLKRTVCSSSSLQKLLKYLKLAVSLRFFRLKSSSFHFSSQANIISDKAVKRTRQRIWGYLEFQSEEVQAELKKSQRTFHTEIEFFSHLKASSTLAFPGLLSNKQSSYPSAKWHRQSSEKLQAASTTSETNCERASGQVFSHFF